MPTARRPAGARPEALFQPPPERQPLAARMRPRDLEEFVGQGHLVGERGPLRRSVARGHLSSTLIVEVRATIAEAQERLALHGTRTVLFLDEIHRFNKAQQDALLPHVEDGTITLVEATTEDPYSVLGAVTTSETRRCDAD